MLKFMDHNAKLPMQDKKVAFAHMLKEMEGAEVEDIM